MKCHCGKALAEKTVATKTHKQGKHTVVDTSRQALVCSEHGVVVWDPRPQFVNAPYLPYVQPVPHPAQPYRPYIQPSVGPNTTRPLNPWFGSNVTSATTNQSIQKLN